MKEELKSPITRAIELAVEGGYQQTAKNWLYQLREFDLNAVFLDPLFWQALGKARGWVGKVVAMERTHHVEQEYWKYQWHEFLDHLIAGKDPDSFFAELLSPNPNK